MHEHVSQSIAALIAAQKPGHALDQRFYTDPDIYALELEKIISRNWFLAGHVSELAEPGDFKVLNVARDSAIIVRGNDGSIRAFANVCRHRGSLVCLESRGNTRKFACPYHGWTYDTDGKLIAARSMPDGFDKSGYSLRPVSYGEIHGLMFICFCDDPPSLEGAIRDLAEPMALFDFRISRSPRTRPTTFLRTGSSPSRITRSVTTARPRTPSTRACIL
jgi:phenylpropionate dioxygenase-like ring-hydroxylating dioxygenase large terminal subunit